MGLFDSLLGTLLGGLNNRQQSGLMGAVSGLVTNNGGIEGLLQKFGGHGLGDLMKGWVASGPNPPATAQNVEQVFGAAQLTELATKAGVPVGDISSHIAKLLPQLVDKMTPDGKVPDAHAEQSGLSSLLSGGLGKLFGQ